MENKYNIKEGDFINILSPMVQKLKLSGNNLLVFALIHGYSKDGEHCFCGSVNYISFWLNISRNAVLNTLKVLVESNYITKKEIYKNAVKFCEYRSNYEDLIKKLDSGCEIAPVVAKTRKGSAKTQLGSCKTEPNNYIYIDKDIYSIKEKEDKSSLKKSVKPDWYLDFNVYKDLVLQAQQTLLSDANVKAQFEKFNPNCDYELSLEKSVETFWGTEDGWENKKKGRAKTINMTSTLKKNIERSKVYKSYGKNSLFDKDAYVKNQIKELDDKMRGEKLIINGVEYK